MNERICVQCFKELSRTETKMCRRCKKRITRASWFRQIGRDMKKFQMETTGSSDIDANVRRVS